MKNMNRNKFIALIIVFCLGYFHPTFAGNPERSGAAGATELIINPYGVSSGLHGLNIATAFGLESLINNPAGLAVGQGSEILFAHTRWLSGSGISINTIGYSGHTRNEGAIGISLVVTSLGEIERTTIDQPDGTLGSYTPNYMYLNFAYAKTFVDGRIFVGANVKTIYESVPDAYAVGVAIDGGVMYSSEDGRFHTGVALRNIGPQMQYKGDGFYTRVNLGNTNVQNIITVPSGNFDLPAQLLIGVAYDFTFSEIHKVTPMFGFVSYSFGKDNLGVGVEYDYNKTFAVRGAFLYETDLFNETLRTTANGGFSGGFSVKLPLSGKDEDGKRKKDSGLRLDYSYRSTFVFNGTHTLGLRLNF